MQIYNTKDETFEIYIKYVDIIIQSILSYVRFIVQRKNVRNSSLLWDCNGGLLYLFYFPK